VDKNFSQMNFTDFKSASAQISLFPIIKGNDLKVNQETSFTFSEEEVARVRERLRTTKRITFRIVGPRPEQGLLGRKQEFNLFTWESGYGEGTFKIKPVLEILYTL
jgi:hypothetical protein